MTDCTQIREGSILTAHTPAVDLDVRLNELDKKLDRSLDGIKDTLRMASKCVDCQSVYQTVDSRM
ncbi:hypothetical protein SARC_17346 [Sphaeroforma arctica JP610]|uniref:Uncharacterized protein n=1 Tax=Sphaeroforma arctica JP610 TaxID=667725 RepID=A0A0L0F0L6_9EUKA|nr:hypothetical protein SARC_17346 [Sphaeroforma arctica JP610]KNC70134.1 hypothetical protein SARC_17346 [Sphaeroforma arctica JP610]|eukprot:XP_014144036.1 hypothetical protein SARC_17346 [Sphaeroforma arctica JP610]